jgi:NitT/TauT family transport system substrate-binding protein
MLARPRRVALAFALATGISSCFAAGALAQSLNKMTLVQMHPIMGIGEEVFLYAVPKRLGYFAAEGLDVDIQNSQTGMISAQVLQSNNAQVGTTAAAAVMAVREQNGDIVSFFNLKRNAGTFLVVLKDSPIRKLEDLKGKTIGAPSFGAGGG